MRTAASRCRAHDDCAFEIPIETRPWPKVRPACSVAGPSSGGVSAGVVASVGVTGMRILPRGPTTGVACVRGALSLWGG